MNIPEEVLRRAKIFRQQIPAHGPTPLLVLPGCGDGDGCISCGAAIGKEHYRCETCAHAARLALEWAAHPGSEPDTAVAQS